MARNLWSDWVPAYRIPEESFLFLGADPCHSPAAERQPKATCAKCGGLTVDDAGRATPNAVLNGEPDPIRAYETVAVVCGGCVRSPWDGTAALDRAVKRPLESTTPAAIVRREAAEVKPVVLDRPTAPTVDGLAGGLGPARPKGLTGKGRDRRRAKPAAC